MAASRRGQPELHVRLPSSSGLVAMPDLPPISALFLIDFDVKAGYTVIWKAAKPGVEPEGVVEYKSLPSGLHTVPEDLIYFVHDGHAGLSAFVNAPVDDTAVRNARMLAVGILVPLSYGRLGRAWKHAESMKAIASKLVVDPENISILEEYWEKHQTHDPSTDNDDDSAPRRDPESSTAASKNSRPGRGHARQRSASDGTALMLPGHKLSPFHPAWSLTRLIDTLGPLIFPIHRAALLRKRILILGNAPVEQACNFVYNISILSNIPLATLDLLTSSSATPRLRPLFSIGVHDIPFLIDDAKHMTNLDDVSSSSSESDAGTGWVACTTDSILSNKETLWDVLITMPPPHTASAKKHVWPTVALPGGVVVRATQRDMRRFRALKTGISRIQKSEEAPLPTTPGTALAYKDSSSALLDEAEQVVEPPTWTALAYSGFMWWASAGEKPRSDEVEEALQDASLLSDSAASATMGMNMPRTVDIAASVSSLTPRQLPNTPSMAPPLDIDEARVELAIIAYFHRLTTQILGILIDAVDAANDESDADDQERAAERDRGGDEDEGDEGDEPLLGANANRGDDDYDGDDAPENDVSIDSDVMKKMGLDRWSAADAEFVRGLLRIYFDRQAYVEGKGVEVCGIRVC